LRSQIVYCNVTNEGLVSELFQGLYGLEAGQ